VLKYWKDAILLTTVRFNSLLTR